MEGPSFPLFPRSPSPPSAESSNSLLQRAEMRRAERRPRAPHQCADCGQIFHDDEALAVHRTRNDCRTADSSDVHRLGSGTAAVQRIPGQYVHPNRSAPRYSMSCQAPVVEQPPQNPNHFLGSEKKLIDLNRMPSLSNLSNPIDDQNPIKNDLFYPLETSYSLSFDDENPKGKRILVDLNDPNPYPKEFLPLIDLNCNPDFDLNDMAPRRDTYLITRDLMSALSPNSDRERGLHPLDHERNGNQAGNLLGLSAHFEPAEAMAAVKEDDNPMALDLNLCL